MPTCLACGSHVSVQFARVFGDDDDDRIHACPACGGKAGIVDVILERSRHDDDRA